MERKLFHVVHFQIKYELGYCLYFASVPEQNIRVSTNQAFHWSISVKMFLKCLLTISLQIVVRVDTSNWYDADGCGDSEE